MANGIRFSPRAGIRGFDTACPGRPSRNGLGKCGHRFSPRAGIRGFDTNSLGRGEVVSYFVASGFSPRGGIRGFDTRLVPAAARGPPGSFSPRAGIRGFDTTLLVLVLIIVAMVASFSPRAGIRGFDTAALGQLSESKPRI